MIKVKDIVWVNEATLSGKPLKHEWYGKVIKIENDMATVRDITNGSYHGQIFNRMLGSLERKRR